jgi:PAS domain S-box-containing protein
VIALGGWLKLVFPEDVPTARRQSLLVLQGQASIEAFRIRTKAGEIRWLNNYVRPEWDASGRYVARVLTAAQDITERKQAEEALRQSEERYKTIFGNSALGIFESTPEGRVLRVNPAYARMFGFASPDDVVSQVADVAQQIYVYPERRAEIVRQVTEHEGVGFFENEYRRRDGTTFIGALTLQTVRGADGAIIQLFGYVQDITERKAAERALRESEARYRAVAEANARLLVQARQDAETKTRLLQEVNHRVKNNLAAIIGLLYTQQRRIPQNQAATQTLVDEMVNQISGLAKVHDMLSASEWSPLPLDELTRQIVSSGLRTAPSPQSVAVEVSPSPVKVTPRQANSLALILNELTTNTLKHGLVSQTTAHIAVRITLEAKTIVLAFSNDGPGYPEAVLRWERPTTGLYLVQSLMTHDLNGAVELRNTPHPVAILRFENGLAD